VEKINDGATIGARWLSFGLLVLAFLIMTQDYATEILALCLFVYDNIARRSS